MKYIKYFNTFVELNTKVASFFPFWVSFLYYIVYLSQANNGISYLNFLIFFIAMLCFDMATTAINHYNAFKEEKDNPSIYDSRTLSLMKELNITMKHNKIIIISLIGIASILGIILVLLSNIGVLLLGGLCFLIGIAYSAGPKPISATPFGEIFAGGTMGVILPVIAIFTQYDHLPFELNPFLVIVFFPLAFLIANILLANNTADVEKDISNKRYTIVYYLGQSNSIILLHLLNILSYIFIAISIFTSFLPNYIFLLILFVLPYSIKNIMKFSANISKQKTFILIVKNFIVFSISYIILLLFCGFLSM